MLVMISVGQIQILDIVDLHELSPCRVCCTCVYLALLVHLFYLAEFVHDKLLSRSFAAICVSPG